MGLNPSYLLKSSLLYSIEIEINLFTFMAKQNQITCSFRIGNGDDGLVGENVGTA